MKHCTRCNQDLAENETHCPVCFKNDRVIECSPARPFPRRAVLIVLAVFAVIAVGGMIALCVSCGGKEPEQAPEEIALREAQAEYDAGRYAAALQRAEAAAGLKPKGEGAKLARDYRAELRGRVESGIQKGTDGTTGARKIYPKNIYAKVKDGYPISDETFEFFAYITMGENKSPVFYLVAGINDYINMRTIELVYRYPGDDIAYQFPARNSHRAKHETGSFEWVSLSLNADYRKYLQRAVEPNHETAMRFFGKETNIDVTLTAAQKENIRLMLMYYYLLTDAASESYADLIAEFAPDPDA